MSSLTSSEKKQIILVGCLTYEVFYTSLATNPQTSFWDAKMAVRSSSPIRFFFSQRICCCFLGKKKIFFDFIFFIFFRIFYFFQKTTVSPLKKKTLMGELENAFRASLCILKPKKIPKYSFTRLLAHFCAPLRTLMKCNFFSC